MGVGSLGVEFGVELERVGLEVEAEGKESKVLAALELGMLSGEAATGATSRAVA